MSPIDRIGGAYIPQTTPASGDAAATAPGTAGPATFDHLAIGDMADTQGPSAAAQRLLTIGMTMPKDQPPGAASSDSGAIRDQANQPFDFSEVSAIFLEFMLTYRKAARLDRQTALEGQISELFGAADKLRTAAEQNFSAAVVQAITSFVGAAFQGVAAGLQGVTLAKMRANVNAQEAVSGDAPNMKSPLSEDIVNPSAIDRTSSRVPGFDEGSISGPGSNIDGPDLAPPGLPRPLSKDLDEDLEELQLHAANSGDGQYTGGRIDGNIKLKQTPIIGDYFSQPNPGDEVPGTPANQSNKLQEAESAPPKAPAISDPEQAAKFKILESKFQILSTQSGLYQSFGQVLNSIDDGVGKFYSARDTRDAAESQADSQVKEALAKKSEAAYSAAVDAAQTSRDTFNKVLDMVAEIERARHETNQSIARI